MRKTILIVCLLMLPVVFSMTGSGTVGDPYIITSVNDLQNIENDVNAYYELGSNIDASATSGWNGGTGFIPIGDSINKFSGQFDGKGYDITDLFMNNPSHDDYVALFEYVIFGSEIKNVGLVDVNITGLSYTGALVGSNNGTIHNSYVTGNVTGGDYTGGMVSWNERSGIVNNSYFSGNVTGLFIGGLVGRNYLTGMINNSFSIGYVNGDFAGGLVSSNDGIISVCFSNSDVIAISGGGGLASQNGEGGTIINCYATGDVNANSGGGLVFYNKGGDFQTPSYIINSYAVGNVSCSGGSCGGIYAVSPCWGYQNCFQDVFFDNQTTGQTGSYGRTTEEMKKQSTFTNWDFVDIWGIEEDVTYPLFGLVTEVYYCGQLGICTDNIMCLIISSLKYFIGMILCIQPIFWVILAGGIGLVILFGMKSLSEKF